MEFIDFILIVMYLSLTASLVTIVWSKMRVWWKTLLGSSLVCTAIALVIWLLPDLLGNSDDGQWLVVADVFIVLIALLLLSALGILIWSMLRRR